MILNPLIFIKNYFFTLLIDCCKLLFQHKHAVPYLKKCLTLPKSGALLQLITLYICEQVLYTIDN